MYVSFDIIGRNGNQKSGTGNSEIRRRKKRQAHKKTPISINTIRNNKWNNETLMKSYYRCNPE